MGYRMYLARVDKEKATPYRTMSAIQFAAKSKEDEETGENTAFYDIIYNFDKKDEYCIGRLPISKNIGEAFFQHDETQTLFEDYNPRVINRNDFISVIDIMRKFIVDYYRDILKHPDTWKATLEDKLDTWEAPYIEPYNLESKTKSMVHSFDAEYQIWDMIRLFKTVNWDTDLVIFYGW